MLSQDEKTRHIQIVNAKFEIINSLLGHDIRGKHGFNIMYQSITGRKENTYTFLNDLIENLTAGINLETCFIIMAVSKAYSE